MRLRGAGLLLACAALLSACVTLRDHAAMPRALPSNWDDRRGELQALTRFDLQGRLAVASGEQGFSAALRWSQRSDRAHLEVDGPLGVGGLRVDLERGRLPDEAVRAELEQRLGFALPLESLRYWMLGVPDPARAAEERRDADSPTLAALTQDGWTVLYTRYARVADGDYELPQRIEVTRESVRVRLLIERWGRVRQ
jgi:outer membrane lipoprotein LolB